MDPAIRKDLEVGTVVNANPVNAGYSPQGTYAQSTIVYGQSPVVNHQPTYSQAQPQVVVNVQPTGRTRPLNHWSDSICDWPSNLFPSCYCVCCCCYGVYILAQMAQKTGFAKFNMVIASYVVFYIVGIIIQAVTGIGAVVWFPMIFSFVFQIALRLYIVRRDNISDCGSSPYIGEFCCGFWCWYCSIAQMARHTYGYQKILDGDGDPDRPDAYAVTQV
mmetsp:Transcript_3330/g.4597  ORF Transcript_3330/g.4597 Transcript_3330/m.4597 type:complete len:218 (+) Transcript_3330:2-655(+)